MFVPLAFQSVNSPSDLQAGLYSASCTFYRDGRSALSALYFEYALHSTGEPQACDLVVIEPDGVVRARDFVWMPDRSWRDSDGLRANRLWALLPPEFLPLQFVRRQALDPVVVEERS